MAGIAADPDARLGAHPRILACLSQGRLKQVMRRVLDADFELAILPQADQKRLASILAGLGLLMNSASVIIRTMLLAPLMAPIVALAMAGLRRDAQLSYTAATSVGIGIGLALLSTIALAVLFPYRPLTDEIAARLNPSLPDLGVAIVSGAAAAIAKSFSTVAQNLAGVAIAVALVPPLAVAGIGIGWLDWHHTYPALLLFTTNLTGIILAAASTFVALGYSPLR